MALDFRPPVGLLTAGMVLTGSLILDLSIGRSRIANDTRSVGRHVPIHRSVASFSVGMLLLIVLVAFTFWILAIYWFWRYG